MKRINLTDTQGRNLPNWFNVDYATEYKEATFHDGRNWISKATGMQFEHECLYKTIGGKYILNRYSI